MRKILILCILLAVVTSANAEVFGRRVLGLYKSSEGQTERENEIFFYLSRPLSKMGLNITYWDVDAGLPPDGTVEDVRAVISWFRGPSITRPEEYLSFLNRIVDSGRKLLVLDNLGAYQNKSSGKYVDTGLINLTLSRLGLMYLGDWTDDPQLISIGYKDSSMVEKGATQDVGQSRFFYRFHSVDRSLQAYLTLKRKDRSYGESPVITTNKDGGFALSRYIYHVKDGKVIMLLDVESFLKQALFPEPLGERIALLADTGHPKASRILESTVSVLHRARLPFEVIPKEAFSDIVADDLRCFTTAAVILPDDAGLDPAFLQSFLDAGGSLVSLLGGRFNQLAPALAYTNKPIGISGAKGYRFRFGFVFGEGLVLDERSLRWQPGTFLPMEDVEVLAHSFDGKVPLCWTTKQGSGRVMVWNWDAFSVGGYLGLLLESFLSVRPVGIASTAGIAVMMLDDWPLPMYNVVKAPLTITDTEFYTQRFWPDIRDYLDGEGIPFISYIVFNYNARTQPPFSGGEFFVAEGMASIEVAREIIEDGRELGFHGYNHLSLTLEETKINLSPWPSVEAMENSLKQAKREWIGLFGEHTLPTAYVPANNIISADGEEALLRSLPSIKTISGLRGGLGEETYTEIGPHPTHPDVYYIPRTSWGYVFDGISQQRIASGMASEGIWSHFVHPDDVLDENRSGGRDWDELLSGLKDMVRFIKRHYPWIRFVTVKDAHEILQRIDGTGVEYRWEGNELVIGTQPGMLFRVRLNDQSLGKIIGARLVHQYKRPSMLIIEATAPEVRIAFR